MRSYGHKGTQQTNHVLAIQHQHQHVTHRMHISRAPTDVETQTAVTVRMTTGHFCETPVTSAVWCATATLRMEFTSRLARPRTASAFSSPASE